MTVGKFSYCAGALASGDCTTNNGNVMNQWIQPLNIFQNYGYDSLNRISVMEESTSASATPACGSGTTPCRAFSYDDWSNMYVSATRVMSPASFTPTSSTWFDTNNRLVNTSLGVIHDSAGNQTNIGGFAFAYDHEGRHHHRRRQSHQSRRSQGGTEAFMETPFAHIRPLDLASEEVGSEELFSAVNSFLAGFRWAKQTGSVWVGESIPGVLGLFLVELMPASEDIDRYIWVVVGDVPPAYISPEYAKTPREALEGYIAEMEAWVEAVQKGEPVDDLIPVNGDPTQENAAALKSRLSFIAEKIMPRLQ